MLPCIYHPWYDASHTNKLQNTRCVSWVCGKFWTPISFAAFCPAREISSFLKDRPQPLPLSEIERRGPKGDAGYPRRACLFTKMGACACHVQLLLEHFFDLFHHFSEARSRRAQVFQGDWEAFRARGGYRIPGYVAYKPCRGCFRAESALDPTPSGSWSSQ